MHQSYPELHSDSWVAAASSTAGASIQVEELGIRRNGFSNRIPASCEPPGCGL